MLSLLQSLPHSFWFHIFFQLEYPWKAMLFVEYIVFCIFLIIDPNMISKWNVISLQSSYNFLIMHPVYDGKVWFMLGLYVVLEASDSATPRKRAEFVWYIRCMCQNIVHCCIVNISPLKNALRTGYFVSMPMQYSQG